MSYQEAETMVYQLPYQLPAYLTLDPTWRPLKKRWSSRYHPTWMPHLVAVHAWEVIQLVFGMRIHEVDRNRAPTNSVADFPRFQEKSEDHVVRGSATVMRDFFQATCRKWNGNMYMNCMFAHVYRYIYILMCVYIYIYINIIYIHMYNAYVHMYTSV